MDVVDIRDLSRRGLPRDAGQETASILLFVPYTCLARQQDRLVEWLVEGGRPNNTVVMDEFHCARRLGGKTGSATARAASALLEASPRRVLLMTASPSDSVASFEYLAAPLGLVGHGAGSFRDFGGLQGALGGRRGPSDSAALEVLFHELAARGGVVSRATGFDGVEYGTVCVTPSPAEMERMRAAALIWGELLAKVLPTDRGVVCGAPRCGSESGTSCPPRSTRAFWRRRPRSRAGSRSS